MPPQRQAKLGMPRPYGWQGMHIFIVRLEQATMAAEDGLIGAGDG
jgi:hypothetical protein